MPKYKRMYANSKLIHKVTEWIDENKPENEHLDYKRCWENNNKELIKDIFSFANTYDNKDSYLIYGVTDQQKHVVGVSNDYRKNQTQVINILSNAKISGEENPPQVEVRTFNYKNDKNRPIDVLIIKNDYDVPVYLEKKNSSKKFTKYNHIYSRRGSVDAIANFETIKLLWKKRFGIGSTLNHRWVMMALKNYKHWQCYRSYNDNNIFFVYDFDPNLRIVADFKSHSSIHNYTGFLYPLNIINAKLSMNLNMHYGKLYLEYNQTPISNSRYNIYINRSNNGYILVKPHSRIIRGGSNTPTVFYYYNYNEYLMNKMIFQSYGSFKRKEHIQAGNPTNKVSNNMFMNIISQHQNKLKKLVKRLIIPFINRSSMNDFIEWINSKSNANYNMDIAIYEKSNKRISCLNNVTSYLMNGISHKDIKESKVEYLMTRYYKDEYDAYTKGINC